MTRLHEIWIRCPQCGLKTKYLMDDDDYYTELSNPRVFSKEKCFRCKPQNSLDLFLDNSVT